MLWFKPVWARDNVTKAVNSVLGMSDQKTLAKIARTAPVDRTRAAAIDKLTDQQVLLDLASSGIPMRLRHAAAIRLTDESTAQPALKALALGHCVEAVEYITDDQDLADIAVRARDQLVASAAVARIVQQDALARVARQAEDLKTRVKAADKLASPKIAQEVLTEVACGDGDIDIRLSAVERLTGQLALQSVAEQAQGSVRLAAARRLKDVELAQSIFADAALNGEIASEREAAVCSLSDPGILATVARSETESSRIGAAAIDRLKKSQYLIADVAMHAASADVREYAVKHLNDDALQAQVFAHYGANHVASASFVDDCARRGHEPGADCICEQCGAEQHTFNDLRSYIRGGVGGAFPELEPVSDHRETCTRCGAVAEWGVMDCVVNCSYCSGTGSVDMYSSDSGVGGGWTETCEFCHGTGDQAWTKRYGRVIYPDGHRVDY